MVKLEKMLFWIENGKNVMFKGKHGVGKTSMILEAFNKAKLNYRYFSASTMDPFIDFCGVPIKVEEDGDVKIKMVLPETIDPEKIEAIFLDEYNRSHKKIRNATMELIQFKSINGRKFPNLKVIWVAVNPDDDESQEYDVEKMDPAQADRFHVHVDIPYRPSKPYFKSKYGDQNGNSAIEWWTNLSTEMKNEVSPRRLDYALEMHIQKGDIFDVLPKESNPTQLKQFLGKGSLLSQMKDIMKRKDVKAAQDLMRDPFYGDMVYDNFLKKEFVSFYGDLIPDEIVNKALTSPRWNSKITNHIMKKLSEEGKYSEHVDEILKANTMNYTKMNAFKKRLSKAGYSAASLTVHLSALNDAFLMLNHGYGGGSIYRKDGYDAIVHILKSSKNDVDKLLTVEHLVNAINIIVDIKARAQKTTLERDFKKVDELEANILQRLADKGYPKDFLSLKADAQIDGFKKPEAVLWRKWLARAKKYGQKQGMHVAQRYHAVQNPSLKDKAHNIKVGEKKSDTKHKEFYNKNLLEEVPF